MGPPAALLTAQVKDLAMLHLLLLLSAGVLAQDHYYCPDGWHISDIGDEIECILLSGLNERVTKADAAVICEFHEGWLVDMDEGRGPQKNNLMKSLIGDADPGSPGFPGNQYETSGGSEQQSMVPTEITSTATGPGITTGLRSPGSTG